MLSETRKPDVLFLGSTYAGHRERFRDLREAARSQQNIRPIFRKITGWRESGAIERLPVPRSIRGRMRAVYEAREFMRFPRPDVIWTSGREELFPWAVSSRGPLAVPVLLDLDATDAQMEDWAPWYWGRSSRTGPAAAFAAWRERAIFRQVSLFTPWSEWAATGLRDVGVDPERIRILPPGLDLERWKPAPATDPSRRLRGLFIGGDFVRKGGDLLIDAAKCLQDEVEIDIVTRGRVGPLPSNVRSWRLERDDPQLAALLAEADFFALPSRAECFGIATIEAMASGIATIVSNAGAAPEIVEHGTTGYIVDASVDELVAAIRALGTDRERTARMGQAARARAQERFDGRSHAGEVFGLLESLAADSDAASELGSAGPTIGTESGS